MRIFCTDLDNTIIYSYKHDIGKLKRMVELYQGREISFITERQFELLEILKKQIIIIPITTRTIEQYNRIDLGIGKFQYALTCNGGVLIENGKESKEWYSESLQMIEESKDVMKEAQELLYSEKRRSFELRYIKELFLFTKCDEPKRVVEYLKRQLNDDLVDIFNNGIKVYVVPKNLSKGCAIQRLRKYLYTEEIIVAGDSEFDVSMLKVGDYGVAPFDLKSYFEEKERINFVPEGVFFGEKLLNDVLTYVNKALL